MTQDQNKKSLRQFQCRDYLWELFEQMGNELECSTDYLINEAMRQYARSRGSPIHTTSHSRVGGSIPSLGRSSAPGQRGSSVPPPPPGRATIPPGGPPGGPPLPGASAPPPPPPGRGYGYGASYPTGAGAYPSASERPSTPYNPGAASPPYATPYYGAATGAPPRYAPSASSVAPPPLPSTRPGQGPTPGRPRLSIFYNGQRIPIDKDEFVIGRGSKTADLPIKDGNISRRHAAVVFQDGQYFIKDLGSTNGMEYQGRRIDSKQIEEGDMIQICDYELTFTYR